jgi:excinuclease UvrABC nuclease subunit
VAKDPAFLFIEEEWKTPNTYNTNFAYPPDKPGVYLIVIPHFDVQGKTTTWEILYVGSAKNLKIRYARHEVVRILREIYQYVCFYFKEEPKFRQVEKQLIKQIQPRFNKQWR